MSMQFVDRKKRTWDLSLDLAIARRIDKSDFKLYYPVEFSFLNINPELLGSLISKPSFMVAVIWAIVQDQAERMPRTGGQCFPISPIENPEDAETEFVSGFNGATIEAARKAFVAALSDFFPEAKIALSNLLNRLDNLQERARKKLEAAETILVQLEDKEIDKAIDNLKQRLGETSISSPQ